ncbi:MAG: hypothetical protein ACTTJ7_01275 [Treponema sp.]
MNKLIIDIEHESSNAITILDNKIRQIEKLITDIDKHIVLVEQEHNKRMFQQQFNENYQLQKAKKEQDFSQRERQNRAFEHSDRANDTHKHEVEIYKKIVNTPDASALSQREQVIELAKQGFSSDFIAERVSLPLGEIALILSINK